VTRRVSNIPKLKTTNIPKLKTTNIPKLKTTFPSEVSKAKKMSRARALVTSM